MDNSYYIYSSARGGWLSRTGNFTTQLSEAATFEEGQAVARCRAFVTSGGGLVAVPVPVYLVRLVLAK